eukprot:4584653-Pleurochrysis_carterae.AAC.1
MCCSTRRSPRSALSVSVAALPARPVDFSCCSDALAGTLVHVVRTEGVAALWKVRRDCAHTRACLRLRA